MAKGATDESAPGNDVVGPESANNEYEHSRPASSDGEEEKSARERLKKTSIAGLSQHAEDGSIKPHSAASSTETNSAEATLDESARSRGRPAKKRSFEDLAKDEAETDGALAQPPLPKSGHHKRMRSRDVGSGDDTETFGQIDGELRATVTREETGADAQKAPGGPAVIVDTPLEANKDDARRDTNISTSMHLKTDTTERASNGNGGSTTSNLPPSSGFANVSTASPFGATSPSKTDSTAAAASAFASSGLSTFASSSASPFGSTAAVKSPSGFASTSSTSGFKGSQPASGFGSIKSSFAGSSGFGSSTTTSVFGSPKPFGNSFGTPKPFGAAPSGFGGGSAPTSFGASKPFSRGDTKKEPEDDGEVANTEEIGDEAASNDNDIDIQQDPRFKEQHIDTGEENETTDFACRAKLYHFAGAGVGWKERGVGTLKINISESIEPLSDTKEGNANAEDPEGGFNTVKQKARLLMRADGVHRVVLNSPIFKGMKFGDTEGNVPLGKLMHLQSLENGKPVPLQIRIGKEDTMRELYYRLKALEADL